MSATACFALAIWMAAFVNQTLASSYASGNSNRDHWVYQGISAVGAAICGKLIVEGISLLPL